jgi:cell wall-associated NlpC family hydrolase
MRRVFYLTAGLLLSVPLCAADPCKISIEKVSHTKGHFSIELGHDEACEVLIDHEEGKIVLAAKAHEENISTSDIKTPSGSNSKVEQMITLAKSKLGDSYEPAKAGPDHFDCSGFVYYVHKENGIKIPRSSLTQSKSGEKLTRKQIKRGDILFFDTHNRGHVNHSGIYLGEGKFIHSSSGKAYAVTISDLDKGFYKEKFLWGVRKIP